MTSLFIVFITLQISLLLIMALHDWVEIRPLTDIRALAAQHTIKDRMSASAIYSIIVLIPLLLTVWYQPILPYAARWCIVIMYGLLTLGTIASWWIPYIFGSSVHHKEGFAEYRNTHTFLPRRGDNVVPNTLHCILHLNAWVCFAISVYFLIQ